MSAMSKKEISAVWLLIFCSHFPLAHLVSIWLEVIISYISQHSTWQPLENRRELVASSWVMYTVRVGRGSNNNRDSKSQRAEFFHSRKKKWVTLPLITHWALCALLLEKWASLLFLCFISTCTAAGVWWRAKKYHNYTWFLKDVQGGKVVCLNFN